MWEVILIAVAVSLGLLGAWRIFLRYTRFGDRFLAVFGCSVALLLCLSLPYLIHWPGAYLLLFGGGLLVVLVVLAGVFGWGKTLPLTVSSNQSALSGDGDQWNLPTEPGASLVDRPDLPALCSNGFVSLPDSGGSGWGKPEVEKLPVAVEPPEVEELPEAAEPPEVEELPEAAEPPEVEELPAAAEPPEVEELPAEVNPPEVEELPAAAESPAGKDVTLAELVDKAFRCKADGDLTGAISLLERAFNLSLSSEDELFVLLEICALYEMLQKHDQAYQCLIRYWEKNRGHLAPHVTAEIENYLRVFRAPKIVSGM